MTVNDHLQLNFTTQQINLSQHCINSTIMQNFTSYCVL